jgi:hypothetical protein
MKLRKNGYLLDDILNFVFGVLDVNDFDSYSLACTFINTARGQPYILCNANKMDINLPFVDFSKAAAAC